MNAAVCLQGRFSFVPDKENDERTPETVVDRPGVVGHMVSQQDAQVEDRIDQEQNAPDLWRRAREEAG